MNTPLTTRERRLAFVQAAISYHLSGDHERAAQAVDCLRRLARDEANKTLCRTFGAPLALRELLKGRLAEAEALLLQVYDSELEA